MIRDWCLQAVLWYSRFCVYSDSKRDCIHYLECEIDVRSFLSNIILSLPLYMVQLLKLQTQRFLALSLSLSLSLSLFLPLYFTEKWHNRFSLKVTSNECSPIPLHSRHCVGKQWCWNSCHDNGLDLWTVCRGIGHFRSHPQWADQLLSWRSKSPRWHQLDFGTSLWVKWKTQYENCQEHFLKIHFRTDESGSLGRFSQTSSSLLWLSVQIVSLLIKFVDWYSSPTN